MINTENMYDITEKMNIVVHLEIIIWIISINNVIM
jgi:hypothetical protein